MRTARSESPSSSAGLCSVYPARAPTPVHHITLRGVSSLCPTRTHPARYPVRIRLRLLEHAFLRISSSGPILLLSRPATHIHIHPPDHVDDNGPGRARILSAAGSPHCSNLLGRPPAVLLRPPSRRLPHLAPPPSAPPARAANCSRHRNRLPGPMKPSVASHPPPLGCPAEPECQ
ncbi:hypothetical protein DFH09DRAFT_1326511 [Mycena vulgaris]|nr:hypothetical protein DFH09DRAFT_1326511 [Mycena vulgaris]